MSEPIEPTETVDPARRGHWGGLTWVSEPRVPEPGEGASRAACCGAIGWGLAKLGGLSAPARLLVAAGGAVAGHYAARHRLRLSWNPDAPTFRGTPPRLDGPEAS